MEVAVAVQSAVMAMNTDVNREESRMAVQHSFSSLFSSSCSLLSAEVLYKGGE